ncbi:MAG: 50S ribosomal protein L13 [Candidatus Ryanbacteria bacterium CG10_big_fil_rev_8_21_14_0_10_43_42]|uniref:Large ribosomal subunit protein uL13 n=1 Tax=Candidatus Ryanbacteria bacterium CG10_big_fil_rev_8_21_14_0_10_43_42 TaxID=1974864 RepID=A0A2M8KX15_9BACT|nr:MAG: 50S ribosomal protein L13 [Candidatus Ryanbacteria bacterium CG10_big_fil_rev_8_21_14_0_10_43_42]
MNTVTKKVHTIDASGKVLGRVATEAAHFLRGKASPSFRPHEKPEDCVVIVNAKKITLSGNKEEVKTYKRYSGYPSGLNYTPYKKAFDRDPGWVIKKAIMGMLPKNKLRKHMISNLTIHNGNSN